jgi:anti-sigma regulatory factor (Ser/Thr protein kinase)
MLMLAPETLPLRYAPVSQTGAGDQLDIDRPRAHIQVAAVEPRNSNRLAADLGVAFGPVGAGGDLLARPPHTGRARQVRQSADDDTRHHTEPVPAPAPEAGNGAAAPALADDRLANSDSGNTFAVDRFNSVPSHGLTAQRLAAPQLEVTVPATAHNATVLRGAFRRWVDCLIDDDVADDLTLAVYEALANAAEHAFIAHPAPGLIWLHALITDGQIIITVTDNGSWRCPTDSNGHRGRGLPLIHQLTTEARLTQSSDGTTVCLRRQLSSAQEGGFGYQADQH